MKFSCYSKSVPKAWLHDKYSTEKEAWLHLFGSRKGGREGKMSFSVLRVCSSLNITCKFVHLWLEVQRTHLELLPGAQGNKKAGKAGKGGMISVFFKFMHPDVLRAGGLQKTPLTAAHSDEIPAASASGRPHGAGISPHTPPHPMEPLWEPSNTRVNTF